MVSALVALPEALGLFLSHPHGGSQWSVTPVLGNLNLLLTSTGTRSWRTCIHSPKSPEAESLPTPQAWQGRFLIPKTTSKCCPLT